MSVANISSASTKQLTFLASQGQCESAEFEVVIYQVTQTPHNQSIINHSTAVPNVCMLLSVFLPISQSKKPVSDHLTNISQEKKMFIS